jgi:hypothetical protein
MRRKHHRAVRVTCISVALLWVSALLPSAVPQPDVQGAVRLKDSSGRDVSGHGVSGIVAAPVAASLCRV